MDKAYDENLIDEAPPQEEITTADVAQTVTEASTTSITTVTATTVSNGCACFDQCAMPAIPPDGQKHRYPKCN